MWAEQQAELLRRLGRGERVNDVDWENLAAEIEDVGRSQLQSVESFVSTKPESPFHSLDAPAN